MAPPAAKQPHPLSIQPSFIANDPSITEPHANEWYRAYKPSYSILEQPLHAPQPLCMIVIGASAAGLQIAYKAERQLPHVTLQIYEKNADVGGMWLENRYPGCTCDIPSHSYQWSFGRNPRWSACYASAPEIWRCLKDFAWTFGLERFVKLEHRVLEARWVEREQMWVVKVCGSDGKVFVDRGKVLACCNGVLNTWKSPDVPGIEKYKGKLMQTAAWDESYDLTGKTVALIGGGSSAVQTIPSIQPRVKSLIPFLRSPCGSQQDLVQNMQHLAE